MEGKFLPVGSVVLIKGGTKRVMITGFCSVDNDNKAIMYDYTGCLYPEGIINSNEICITKKVPSNFGKIINKNTYQIKVCTNKK